ncbi:MAG: Rdx family protein [Candidatus Nanohaloarchaea archaeon]
MIKIRYCGVCGDYGLVEKIKNELSGKTGIDEENIETVECGSCSMEVSMEGETVFTEEKDFLDVGKVVEDIKSGLEARA